MPKIGASKYLYLVSIVKFSFLRLILYETGFAPVWKYVNAPFFFEKPQTKSQDQLLEAKVSNLKSGYFVSILLMYERR